VETRAILDAEVAQLEKDRLQLYDILSASDMMGKPKAPLPVNINRVITNAQKRFKVDTNKPSDLNPVYVACAGSAVGSPPSATTNLLHVSPFAATSSSK